MTAVTIIAIGLASSKLVAIFLSEDQSKSLPILKNISR